MHICVQEVEWERKVGDGDRGRSLVEGKDTHHEKALNIAASIEKEGDFLYNIITSVYNKIWWRCVSPVHSSTLT